MTDAEGGRGRGRWSKDGVAEAMRRRGRSSHGRRGVLLASGTQSQAMGQDEIAGNAVVRVSSG